MRILPAVLIILTAVTARAETKIAVPDMKVTGAEASLGPILTEIMTTEISKLSGITVVGSSDITAMLGFEQEKQLLGCADDISCMAEIGGALGVDMLLVSDLGLVGDTHVLNLKLIDTAEVKVLNRLYKTVAGKADALIEIVRNSVPELLAPVKDGRVSAKPPTAGDVETPHELTAPPVEAAVASGSSRSTWMQWTLIGVGGAAILVGTGLQIAGKGEYDQAWEHSYELDGARIHATDTTSRFESASQLSTAALALFITGGAMAAGGLTWLLLAPDAETSVAIAPVVSGDAAGFAVTGGF